MNPFFLEKEGILGNRCVIVQNLEGDTYTQDDVGLYLHWNGGRDSVTAFLTYADLAGATDLSGLSQIIGNFFQQDGNRVSGMRIEKVRDLDHESDNGVYVVGGLVERWAIKSRRIFSGNSEQKSHLLGDMLISIFLSQPKGAQKPVKNNLIGFLQDLDKDLNFSDEILYSSKQVYKMITGENMPVDRLANDLINPNEEEW